MPVPTSGQFHPTDVKIPEDDDLFINSEKSF